MQFIHEVTGYQKDAKTSTNNSISRKSDEL
jgi:hypothetical protein